MVKAILPPSAAAPQCRMSTRETARSAAHHPSQLTSILPLQSRNNTLSSFPHSLIAMWNQLPPTLLQSPPSRRGMHTFKKKSQRLLAAQQVGVGHRQAMISPSKPTHQPNYTDRTPAPFYPSLIPLAQPCYPIISSLHLPTVHCFYYCFVLSQSQILPIIVCKAGASLLDAHVSFLLCIGAQE